MEIIDLMESYVRDCKNSKIFINVIYKKITIDEVDIKNGIHNSIIIISGNELAEALYYKFDYKINEPVTISFGKYKDREVSDFLKLLNTDTKFKTKLVSILEKELLKL